MRLFGSLTNRMMENGRPSTPYVPQVGDGATELCWSDRHPFTVIRVISATTVEVQADNCSWPFEKMGYRAMGDNSKWEFSRNPEGHTRIVTLRKNGRWVTKGEGMKNGTSFGMGFRDRNHDDGF